MLSEEEKRLIGEAAQSGKSVAAETKLFEPVYKLKTGKPVESALGLEDRMCVDRQHFFALISKGVDGIQEEVEKFSSESADPGAKEVLNLLNYIRFEATSEKEYSNGIRDKGRPPMKLVSFLMHRKAQDAHLNEEEVVALRLYTTMAFKFMNIPLRDDQRHAQGAPCPLAVTTHFAVTGIKKLRALHVESGCITLWRGMRNLEVAERFMHDGGTELGFMSTTTNLHVAVEYSKSEHSLLFKIVPPSFMATGADVQWLSAFPGEAEILYPPLTYLRPTGRTEEVSVVCGEQRRNFSVVEVEPQFA
jgi:hypothetical protein